MTDPAAQLHMFLAVRRELVSYAAKIIGDRTQAEDIVQEAWIRFTPQQTGTRQAIEQPIAYLYRIVRNLALDLMRSRVRETEHQAVAPGWLLATASDPADTCQHTMALERLFDALDAMPENSRRALELHRFGGCTLAEIAAQLGVSLTTAHRLLREALIALAKVVDEADDAEPNSKEASREH